MQFASIIKSCKPFGWPASSCIQTYMPWHIHERFRSLVRTTIGSRIFHSPAVAWGCPFNHSLIHVTPLHRYFSCRLPPHIRACMPLIDMLLFLRAFVLSTFCAFVHVFIESNSKRVPIYPQRSIIYAVILAHNMYFIHTWEIPWTHTIRRSRIPSCLCLQSFSHAFVHFFHVFGT